MSEETLEGSVIYTKLDDSHKHVYYKRDKEGVKIEDTTGDHGKYHYYKGLLLLVCLLCFVFSFGFSSLAYSLAFIENEVGSGWLVSEHTFLVGTCIYGILGLCLLIVYFITSLRFALFQEQQKIELSENIVGMGTIYIVDITLLISFFFMGEKDNNARDMAYRRTLYAVFTSHGCLGVLLIIRSLCRHFTFQREVVIGEKPWQEMSTFINNVKEFISNNPGSAIQITRKIGGKFIYTACLIVPSLTVFIIAIVMLSFHDYPEQFSTLFFVTVPILLASFVCTGTVWIMWAIFSRPFKGSFVAHFDVFYVSHTLFTMLIIFMLVGYHLNYSKISNNLFPEDDVVSSLKTAYWGKLNTNILCFLPLFMMGISKGTSIFSPRFPLEVKVLRSAVHGHIN